MASSEKVALKPSFLNVSERIRVFYFADSEGCLQGGFVGRNTSDSIANIYWGKPKVTEEEVAEEVEMLTLEE